MWQRIVVRQGREYVRQGRTFVRYVAPAVIKPARTLWNDFIAFLFFCLAVPFGYRAYTFARSDHPGWVPLAIVTAVLMFFAVSSYLRARRISRS